VRGHRSGSLSWSVRCRGRSRTPRLFRIRLRLAMAGDPAASCLRANFGGRLRLCDSRTLALGHAKTPLNRVGARSRRHYLNPAEAEGRWRGREEQAIRLAGRDTTHALLAGKVQRKVRNGVANLPPPDHLWKILAMSAMRLDERVLAEIPGTRLELRPRTAAAQTRIVSVARIRLGPRNLRDLSKG
jgi:hypothetical protein